MCDDDDSVQVVAALILEYLAAHPDAADGIEGIRRWWLPSHTAARTVDVEAALDWLVKASKLTQRQLPDGGILYVRRYL